MKYVLDENNRFGKIGNVYVMSGMALKLQNGTEGLCEFDPLGKLYIYPASGELGTLVNVGEDVEVVSEQRNIQELERRKSVIFHRQLSWQDQMGEETRLFDPSNEGW